MKIDKEKYETLSYKALDINEGIINLGRKELEEEKAKILKEDLIKQLEELKKILESI